MLVFSSGGKDVIHHHPSLHIIPLVCYRHVHTPALSPSAEKRAAGTSTIPPHSTIISTHAHTSLYITNVGAGMTRSDWCQPTQAADPIISL